MKLHGKKYAILALFLLFQQVEPGYLGEILEAPVDQVVFPETNATFFCHGRGVVDWAVNNTFLVSNNIINTFRERGFVQKKVRLNPGITPAVYNISLTALGSLENNNTNVTCRAYGSDPGEDNHTATLIVAEILEAPVDQIVFPETNATFFCHGRGMVDWAVNNTFLLNDNTINEFRERGFVQKKVRLNPGNTPAEYNISLTALGSLENNNTNVTCRAYGSDPGEDSHTATLIVAGPPQPPAPEVEAVNATTLRFFWDTPLCWEEFPVEVYRIRLINNSSGEIIVDKTTAAMEFLYEWDDGDAENYQQLIFTVTASNAVGTSTIGSVNGGSFPIAGRIITFTPTRLLPQHPNATVEIFCYSEGESRWHVNRSIIGTANHTYLEVMRGFSFTIDNEHAPQYTGRNVTVKVSGNNNTIIGCAAVGGSASANASVTILVAGPPLPPSPVLRVVNATTLQLSWKDPFTPEGHQIRNFTVSVLNYTEEHVISERVFNLSREGIAQTCEELHFTVIATNDVGESQAADISIEFPIAPGQFESPVEHDVTFHSDGTPQLEVCFTPPQICRSQNSNLTIIIQKLGDSGESLTVYATGPERYYTNGSGLERRNISSGLETNQMYSITVLFSTIAGDSSSSADFNTNTAESPNPTSGMDTQSPDPTTDVQSPDPTPDVQSPDPDNSNTTWIIGAAVGTLCAVVLVLGIGLLAACTYLKRRAERDDKLTASAQGMVPNPLYEGPLYDFINDSSQLKALSRERAKDSCYVDIPPRVFAPKEEKDMYSKIDQGYENIKLSAKVGTGFVVASSSAEEAYTVMQPAGTLKSHNTTPEEVSSPDDKNRYVLGE